MKGIIVSVAPRPDAAGLKHVQRPGESVCHREHGSEGNI